MQLMPAAMGEHAEYEYFFGEMDPTMRPQCAVVKSNREREHVRLLAKRRDLQLWTAETRPMVLGGTRSYPRGLRSDEAWVTELLDPWLTGPLHGLELRLPDTPSAHSGLMLLEATLTGLPDAPPTLKQLVVSRSARVVTAFDIVSCGRCWYRELVWTSEAMRSLHQPDAVRAPAHSNGAAPSAARGDTLQPYIQTTSLRVGRIDGLSSRGEEQTFLPHRFLRGLIPDALLEQYDFWQGHADQSLDGFETAGVASAAVVHHRLYVDISLLNKTVSHPLRFASS